MTTTRFDTVYVVGGLVPGECYDHLDFTLLDTSAMVARLNQQAEALTTHEHNDLERKRLIAALDHEMVNSCMGVFESGDDPTKTINALIQWGIDLHVYFERKEAAYYRQLKQMPLAVLLQWHAAEYPEEVLDLAPHVASAAQAT